MKRLIFAVISPFVGLMFIWLAVGYMRYGESILSMHLDLEKTISILNNYEYEFQLINLWNGMVDRLSEINNSSIFTDFVSKLHLGGFAASVVEDILSGIRSVLNPFVFMGNFSVILVSILDAILDLIYFLFGYVSAIINFVFNPVFV